MNRHLCLAVCAPGIEELCAGEITAIQARVRRTFRGGVEFSATDRQLYAANLWSRTANRIVVRVARYAASNFSQLQRGAADVPWDAWIPDGTTPTVRVSATSSHLSHTDAIAERLAEVMRRGTAPGPLVIARLIHDRVMLSVDSSGDALYQRGWRRSAVEAPLRETLGAALVLASGWDGSAPLVDPMCGSGTVPIEAAMIAAGRAPGEGRRFAFQDWPTFAPGTWASVAAVPPARRTPVIVAADRDRGAIEATAANAERAEVEVVVRRDSLREITPPPGGPGWVVSNPPYGKRLAIGRDLYADLGEAVRTRFPGWRVGLLVADAEAGDATGLELTERLRTRNGGIRVRVLATPADTVAA